MGLFAISIVARFPSAPRFRFTLSETANRAGARFRRRKAAVLFRQPLGGGAEGPRLLQRESHFMVGLRRASARTKHFRKSSAEKTADRRIFRRPASTALIEPVSAKKDAGFFCHADPCLGRIRGPSTGFLKARSLDDGLERPRLPTIPCVSAPSVLWAGNFALRSVRSQPHDG